MTVSSLTNRVNYSGTGIVGPYSYPFRIQAVGDLEVITVVGGIQSTLAYPGDYSVSGVGARNGGSVTLTQTLANGSTLTLKRSVPLTQLTNIRNQGPYFPETLEDALDRQTMAAQQLDDALSRAPTLADSIDPAGYDLTLPTPSASKAIVWNVAGTGFSNATLSAAQLSAWSAANNQRVDVFVSPTNFTAGVTTQLTLTADPGNKDNTTITRTTSGASVVYTRDQYSIVGSVITFTAVIPANTTRIEVAYLLTYQVNTVDAANATWNAAQAGAVARSVRDKLRETILSAKDYGALGDSTGSGAGTDDTVSLGKARDAITTAGGGNINHPPGSYRATASLIYTKAATLEGIGSPGSGATLYTQSALLHDFDGDLLTFNGSGGSALGAGGGVRNMQLRQVFGAGGFAPGRGRAILVTGSTLNLRANWIRIENVNIENVTGNDEWTWGIDIDGSPVGGTDGVRDMFISKSRITANTAAGGAIRIWNAFNVFLSDTECSLANSRVLISGTAGNASASVFLANCSLSGLALDFASQVHAAGGAVTSVTTTANTSDTNLRFGYFGSMPTVVLGSRVWLEGINGATGIVTMMSSETIVKRFSRERTAGGSTTTIVSVGNTGANQGDIQLRYTNDTAAGGPIGGVRFFPRNNADTSNLDGGGIEVTKIGGLDQTKCEAVSTGGRATLVNTNGDMLPIGNVDVPAGKVFKVNTIQVVGARGAAVADVASANATDLATAITLVNELKAQVNTLLARVRTHGLIA